MGRIRKVHGETGIEIEKGRGEREQGWGGVG